MDQTQKVKLVSITRPIISDTLVGAEDLIVYCARVSNPNNQLNISSAPKLLKYLIDHKHWSPFEMVSMCVEIKTSRAIAAQILRHRSFSFQEFSQRYSEATELERVELRAQADKNRQSSTSLLGDQALEQEVAEHLAASKRLYGKLISRGAAKECARMVLPLATQTTLYMSGSARSWIHYLQIRCEHNVQKEHREIALQIMNLFCESFPNTSDALMWSI